MHKSARLLIYRKLPEPPESTPNVYSTHPRTELTIEAFAQPDTNTADPTNPPPG